MKETFSIKKMRSGDTKFIQALKKRPKLFLLVLTLGLNLKRHEDWFE